MRDRKRRFSPRTSFSSSRSPPREEMRDDDCRFSPGLNNDLRRLLAPPGLEPQTQPAESAPRLRAAGRAPFPRTGVVAPVPQADRHRGGRGSSAASSSSMRALPALLLMGVAP